VNEVMEIIADEIYQSQSIEELGLSTEINNILRRNGVKRIGQVIELGDWGLRQLKGISEVCAQEVMEKID